MGYGSPGGCLVGGLGVGVVALGALGGREVGLEHGGPLLEGADLFVADAHLEVEVRAPGAERRHELFGLVQHGEQLSARGWASFGRGCHRFSIRLSRASRASRRSSWSSRRS